MNWISILNIQPESDLYPQIFNAIIMIA